MFLWSRIPMKIFWQNKTDSRLPGLVIWNETTRIKKTLSINSLLRSWLPHSCWQTVHMWKRSKESCRHVLCSKDRWFIGHWVVSGHAFIREVAVILEQQEASTHYCTHMSFIILVSSALTTRFRMMPELSAISAVSLWRTLWNSSTCSWKWLACIKYRTAGYFGVH